jgi:hypothetical protein
MFFATRSLFLLASEVVGLINSFDVLDDRGCVRWTGDAQRSAEGSPPDRCA